MVATLRVCEVRENLVLPEALKILLLCVYMVCVVACASAHG